MKLNFMKKTNVRTRPCRGRFLCVDMGSRWVQLVLAEHNGRGTRLLKLASVELPDALDMQDTSALGQWLKQTLKQNQMSASNVLMCVPRGKTILKPLSLPQAPSVGEMAGMVHYQVSRDIPFKTGAASIDFIAESHYQTTGTMGTTDTTEEDSQNIDVLAAVVNGSTTDYYRNIADAAGMKLHRLGLRPYADVRCVHELSHVESSQHVAVVHITADHTEIGVMVNGLLEFSRSAELEVPSLSSSTQGQEDQRHDDSDAIIAASAKTVAHEVAQSIQIYRMSQNNRRVDRIMVAGATGIEQHVAECLAKLTETQADVLDPNHSLQIDHGSESAAACISAIGMALSDRDEAGPPFDFANPRKPVAPKSKWRRYGPPAGIAAAVILIPSLIMAMMSMSDKHTHYDELVSTLNQLEKKNKLVVKLGKEVKDLEAWSQRGENWLDHWTYISSLMPPAEDVYIRGIKTSAEKVVNFTIKARNADVLADLAERLSKAGYDYKPERTESQANSLGYTYVINVRVQATDQVKIDLASLKVEPRSADDDSLRIFNTVRMRSSSSRSFRPSSRPSSSSRGRSR